MIFRYCEEGSGESVQTCRLPRAFAAGTRDLDIYYTLTLLALMCRLTRVFAAGVNTHKSPFKAALEILYSDED